MVNHRYLHFATHGFYSPEPVNPNDFPLAGLESLPRQIGPNPYLRCGLVCAGANNPMADEDGMLTALEIMDLDLGGVELAVLSACETSLGTIANGDGVLGLQRAFHAAGARATAASLWRVPDAATTVLMTRFYENHWAKGRPALEALREAQIWLLNHPAEAGLVDVARRKGRRTPPLYWAAFTIAGDWR